MIVDLKNLLRLLFENSPFDAKWTALACGFAIVAPDGCLYLTAFGQEYLSGVDQ